MLNGNQQEIFIDPDETMNEKNYKYIEVNGVLEHLWSDQVDDTDYTTTEKGV